MYRNILLAIAVHPDAPLSDHAQAAQEAATQLAKGAGAAVHLLTVYDYGDTRATRAVGMPTESEVVAMEISSERSTDEQEIDARIERRLDDVARTMHAQGIQVTTEKIVGEPDEEIVRAAKRTQADLIVIGSHHKRNILDIGLGSNARAVAGNAPCPVVMINPN